MVAEEQRLTLDQQLEEATVQLLRVFLETLELAHPFFFKGQELASLLQELCTPLARGGNGWQRGVAA